MKSKITSSVLIVFVLLITSTSINGQIKKSFRCVWELSGPDCPTSYEIAEVTITKDSVFSKYPDDPYVYPSKSTSFKNDTLTYTVVNQGTEVFHSLTLESKKRK